VLITLREHDFKDAFKKMAKALRTVPVGPKIIFDQVAAPVSEIMDGSL
jgi:hypothetical protein